MGTTLLPLRGSERPPRGSPDPELSPISVPLQRDGAEGHLSPGLPGCLELSSVPKAVTARVTHPRRPPPGAPAARCLARGASVGGPPDRTPPQAEPRPGPQASSCSWDQRPSGLCLPHLTMRKPQLTEGRGLAWGHTGRAWPGLEPRLPDLRPASPTTQVSAGNPASVVQPSRGKDSKSLSRTSAKIYI